ncbi:MAG: NdvB protein, partial [Anaerolineae bacterium]
MIVQPINNGERFDLLTPTAMPRAAGFLWNRHMMIQVNCRGYAVAQYMNPEPAKYMYAPNLEAKTFMQPEQPYYAHHPGRFFYIKDEESGELFSAPYEPVRQTLDNYRFSVGKSDIRWVVQHLGIEVTMQLSLPSDDVVELWQLSVKNLSGRPRKISVYPYFPIGYMSWMNQSAVFRPDLGGIVATCVSPYQKVADWLEKVQYYKDKTFFLADRQPDAFECNREIFEGEGGLHNPSAVQQTTLDDGDAIYETPVSALQFRLDLAADQTENYRFLLGPAIDDVEIVAKRDKYFADEGFEQTAADYSAHIAQGQGSIQIETPDSHLDQFVNHWLPRQVFYLGDVNRLTTDPQTRNYLQDNMGMSYIDPGVTRKAFLHALSQQEASGSMPDGILLTEDAELKYINQIPHTDHCIWVPVCLRAYLDETNDYSIL